MLIIDSQVHAYERNHPGRPWAGVLTGPAEVTGDGMVAAMDAVGVAGAVLVSPFTMYGYDASYALAVHRQHPGRFGLVKPVDPNDPAVAETIADWAAMLPRTASRSCGSSISRPSAPAASIRASPSKPEATASAHFADKT